MNTDSTISYDELLKVMPQIAETVNAFKGEAVQREVLLALLSKLGVDTSDAPDGGSVDDGNGNGRRGGGSKVGGEAPKAKVPAAPNKKRPSSKKSGPSLVTSLNLRPKDKQTLEELAAEKGPKNQQEKSTLIVYYLRHVLRQDAVTVDSVYTAYKAMKWRLPANLENQLQVIKATKGWLDTSNMSAIELTSLGENYIEHDLPKSQAS